ncbi:hypothetical protein BIW11_02838 [Tropilaelaps mercedesae]|uniref:Uncharacterized protein n=1 Tax=Tropilaelaps mercedesae TaxID=418985 RepID=A0A1V9XWS4_9ACAR|nr:hypothetical protein BIW11_02838 [Tropilaelaps mercedesae]
MRRKRRRRIWPCDLSEEVELPLWNQREQPPNELLITHSITKPVDLMARPPPPSFTIYTYCAVLPAVLRDEFIMRAACVKWQLHTDLRCYWGAPPLGVVEFVHNSYSSHYDVLLRNSPVFPKVPRSDGNGLRGSRRALPPVEKNSANTLLSGQATLSDKPQKLPDCSDSSGSLYISGCMTGSLSPHWFLSTLLFSPDPSP